MMNRTAQALFAIALTASACLTVTPMPQPIVDEPAHADTSFLHKSYEFETTACAAAARTALRALGYPIVSEEDAALVSRREDGTPIRLEWSMPAPGWTHVNFMVGDEPSTRNHWTAVQIKAMFEQALYRRAWKQP